MHWSDLPRTRRALIALCALSWAGWSGWELLRPARNPLMDLSGWYTDHFSHMNTARIFLRFGTAIWRTSPQQMLPRPTPEVRARLPPDVFQCADCLFVAPGWKKPVLLTWPNVVRPYPPGDMLLTAPIAALYHFTDLSATDANRLLLVLFLAFAHVAIFLLLDGLAFAPGNLRWHALLPGFLGSFALLHWTLEGFYDASFVVLLLLCWRWLGERRALAAIVAFCAASFLHFRAYYYAPWALAAAALVVRERRWQAWHGRDWAALGAAVLLGGASLATFALVLPSLLSYKVYLSPLFVSRDHRIAPALFLGALIAAVALAAFAAARSWIDALMVPWLAMILTTVRVSEPWYVVATVPWLCAPPRAGLPERHPLVLDARVLVFLFLATAVHGDPRAGLDVIPTWLVRVFW